MSAPHKYAVEVMSPNHRAVTSSRAGSYQEPPEDMDSLMSPAARAAYPSAAATVDAAVADALLREALMVSFGSCACLM